jgi:hypothetical protein
MIRKIFSLIMVAVMMTALAVPALAESRASKTPEVRNEVIGDPIHVVRGDADDNGEVNVADVIIVFRACMGLITLDPASQGFLNADCDGNGEINVADAIITSRIAMGLGGY